MASVAARFGVSACQWIFGIATMIKVYALPIERTVATCAIGRKAAFMRVVLRMAGDAGDGCALERFADMAGFTGYGHMLASEREFRQAMIKLHILFPAYVAVTIRSEERRVGKECA